MNFTNLRYFIEVARYKSFSEAARQLYSSQPNLSKQIGLLEAELGFKLFTRVNRTVALTPAGQYLFDTLKNIPDQITKATERAKVIGRDKSGRLSIGILEGQHLNSFLPNAIGQYQKTMAALEFELECSGFRQLRRGLESCQYDMIITISIELGGFSEAVCSAKLIDQYAGIAVSAKRHISLEDHRIFSDFKNERFITVSPEESPRIFERFMKLGAYCGFTPEIARKVSSLESLLLCVEMDLGVAIVDRDAALDKSYAINVLPISDGRPEDIVAVWREDNANANLTAFTSFLASYCQALGSVKKCS